MSCSLSCLDEVYVYTYQIDIMNQYLNKNIFIYKEQL